MSADIQQAVLIQRPVFKMNPAADFWQRGPPSASPQLSPDTQQQNGQQDYATTVTPATTTTGTQPQPQDQLLQRQSPECQNQQQQQPQPQPQQQTQQQSQQTQSSVGSPHEPAQHTSPPIVRSPQNHLQQQQQLHQQQLQQQHQLQGVQQNPQELPQDLQVACVSPSLQLPDPKAMTEKLVSELQNRSGVISDRTLEECWNALQRIFMRKSAMQMHARELQRPPEVNKPHQCQQCLKSFSSNHQLVQHIRVHTGEKPYKCSYCERRFKQLSHVQQHTRLHTGERPYRCHLAECGRAFIQLSNLQQHLRNHDAQVERAKNRPFHCTICGKGFATESSLRTHTTKCQQSPRTGWGDAHCFWPFSGNHRDIAEAELRVDVLQQHAALIGGPNTTSCPVCHKIFLGTEALMDHMKHSHKDPNNPTGPVTGAVGYGDMTVSPYIAKRRTANHPCPVCGKHYVNEGSLRKHLACHPETAQFATSLRMWPCSVCQSVFTHESGLLTHMEHMRMDPKHQFAAQYVLSRAAAERRERESLIAAAAAGGLNLALTGAGVQAGTGPGGPGGQQGVPNQQPGSPSAASDSSSQGGEGRLSSAGSDTAPNSTSLLLHNNNNNNNTATAKLAELMAARSGLVEAGGSNGHPFLNQAASQYSPDDLQRAANALIAVGQQQAAAAAAAAMGSADSTSPAASVVQVAAANFAAAAMRMSSASQLQQNQQVHSNGQVGSNADSMSSAMQLMNAAVRASMTSMVMENNHQLQSPQESPAALRMQEVILRSQAEAAIRLAVTQAVVASTSSDNGMRGGNGNGNAGTGNGSQGNQGGQNTPAPTPQYHHTGQVSPDLTEALRLQEQRLEQALRLHGDPRALGFSLSNPPQHHINP
ncbi:zinc finger protein 629 isoform X2 [Cimex lectularius]|uniref:C2H2-type domain-containing protein n=1 Tax=Cimex lectularius TaxID=79782 RepID=A0A8I6SC59_CIMLE|nr:zinc finger protein 629 isoform X2 [Cimex lectularius]